MTRRLAGWLIAFGSTLWFAPGCATSENNVGSGGFSGTVGVGGGQAGCTKSPDCNACNTCFEQCVCNGATPNSCVQHCGSTGGASNTGGSSFGGAGNTANGGSSFGGTSSGGSSFGGSSFGGTSSGGSSFGGSSFGGSSFGGSSFGGTGGSAGGGNCCAAQSGPSCSNTTVMNCVCAQDDFCCTTLWDDYCASEVTSFGCGTCAGGTGGTSGGGGTGGSGGCTVQLQDPTCNTCMQASCCSSAEACANDTTCAGLLSCAQTSCATATDINTCIQQNCSQYAAGMTLMNAYFSCMNTNCLTACGG